MPFITPDRCQETTTTTGTGNITLAGAFNASTVTFASRFAVGDTTFYVIAAVDSNGNPNGVWEAGIGTYSATNTLTRTLVLANSAGTAPTAINFGAGTKTVTVAPSGVRQRKFKMQAFTTSGTWTADADIQGVRVWLVGGGGGGGAGRKHSTTAARAGGGGGGGGGITEVYIPAADLPSTAYTSGVSISLGVGGAGAPSQTTNGTNGLAGTAGGDTTFGSLATAGGGSGGTGGAATSAGGVSPGAGTIIGGAGGATSISAVAPAFTSPGSTGGGGGGGGINTSNAVQASAAGQLSIAGAGGAAGATGSAGGAGAISPAGQYFGGAGGGGGGASITGNAGAGGNGGLYGAGGGGGGAATSSVGDSGAGGNGADGVAVVVSFY